MAQLSLSNTSNKIAVIKYIKKERTKLKFSDLTIETSDGVKLRVHKAIMAAASPFFKELLKNQTESVFVDCHADILEGMLQFIYTSKLISSW